jgi:CDP-paratose 2-epimerase
MNKKLLVTGSSGLIGSEVVEGFCSEGWEVYGVDNNMRAVLFGPQGDTRWNQRRLIEQYPSFEHREVDIRNREKVLTLIRTIRPDAIIHTAAQPSHDLAARRPFDDFDVNALGTMNLLEAARRFCAESPFIHMSTNKVYGDAPNELRLIELENRWDYASIKAFPVWGFQGGGGCDGARVRSLLCHANMLPSGWMPDWPVSFRGRATWFSELPN